MTNFPVTAADTGVSVSDSLAVLAARKVADTGLSVSATLSRLAGRAQPTTTGLTVADSIRATHKLALADTGATVTETLRRDHPISLVSAAFPSFAPDAEILDNFNRANENPLSQGGNWTNLGGLTLALVSNAVVGNSAGNDCAMSYSGAGDFTDVDAWVTLTGSPSGPGASLYSGVFARQAHTGFVIATSHRSYQVISSPGANEILLQYVNVGGGVTVLASWPIKTKVGDSLGIRCVGTTISAYYKPVGGDWQLLGSATGQTQEASGYVGLISSDTTFSMDNFGAGLPSAARPFDSIQPNHYAVALTDDVFLQPFAAATSVLDNFQRPNELPLSGGGRWARTGSYGANLNLVSHLTVPGTSNQIDSESYVAAGDLHDCEVWGTLNPVPWSGAFDSAGLILRQNPPIDSQKDCYILAYESDGSLLYLTYTDSSGTSSTLASWPLVLANGDSIGLRAVGTKLTAYYRHGAGAWQTAGSVTHVPPVGSGHGYLGIQQLNGSGVPSGFTSFGGGPVGVYDSILPIYAPGGLFPTTGLTVTDAISPTARSHSLADTGLTVTDGMVLFLNGNAIVSLTDNGLVLSDAIQKFHSTSMTDTGLPPITDSITNYPNRGRLPVDQGLTFSDTLGKAATKAFSDTGLSLADSAARSYPVSTTTTGLTLADSIQKKAPKVIADTGLAVTDALVVRLNGHNTSVSLTDRGASIVGSIARTASLFRSVPIYAPETGLTISDGIRRTVTPPTPPPPRIKADFSFAVSGLSVVFNDESTPGPTGPIVSWFWTFDDGGTSTAQNPSHTYTGANTYTVTLTVEGTGPDGFDSVSKPVTVFVPAVAGFHLDLVVV